MSPHDAKPTGPVTSRFVFGVCLPSFGTSGLFASTTDVRTGVYAGAGENTYWKHYLQPQMTHLQATVGDYRLHIMNDKDCHADGLQTKPERSCFEHSNCLFNFASGRTCGVPKSVELLNAIWLWQAWLA